MSDRERSKLEAVVVMVTSVLYIALMVVMVIPDHTRKLYLLKAAASLRQLAGQLAALQGRRAMARELAGVRPAYELPEALSRLRDYATHVYEELRHS